MSNIRTANQLKGRNTGIDLLRIVAVFYVVVLHSLYHGGILDNVEYNTSNYSVVWEVEIWCLCAVNIFALVSGYVGYRGEHRPIIKSYIQLWLEVVFYSFFLAILVPLLFSETISIGSLLDCFLPVTKGAYWFFTAYTGAIIVSPIVFAGVRELNTHICTKLLPVFILIIPIWSMISDPFKLQKGYSAGWLLIMFSIGAILRKTNLLEGIKVSTALMGIMTMNVMTFILQLLQGEREGFFENNITFSSYVSPLMVITAICYLCAFEKMKINNRYIAIAIRILAPGAFAVYLINDNNLFRAHFISQRFLQLLSADNYWMIAVIIASSVLFVLVCLLIDVLRRKVFRLFKVEEFASMIEKRLINLRGGVK